MTKPLEQVEDLRKRLHTMDKDRDGLLSVDEFRIAIFVYLDVRNLTENELDQLIDLMWVDDDTENPGMRGVDINDFIELLKNAGSLDLQQDTGNLSEVARMRTSQKCLFQIRNAVSFDLFSYLTLFETMPDFLEPSFL